jgi:DNA-binding LacI/PurR family transcriptional regulator
VERPTATFGGNYLIACGAFPALRALREALAEIWPMAPFLQPAYELGRRAAELLFERPDRGAAREPRKIVLPTELIVRRSSGPPSPEAL